MAKPARDNIQNGLNGWDASVNNNFIRVFDRPLPIFLHTGDQTDIETSFPAALHDECLVVVDHTVVGQLLYMVDKAHPSGSATWVPLSLRHANKVPPTAEVGATTLGPDELTVIGNPAGNVSYTLAPVADMAGLTVKIKNISAFVITADANLAETIDGALTFPIPANASADLYCDGVVWHVLAVNLPATTPSPIPIIVAVGDEITAITTGTAKVTFRMPYAFTLTEVRASLTTVSSAGIPTIDINEGGVTILSTKLTIDASELTSETAATPVVISDGDLADDAEITIDIDVAGTGAAGLKVTLIGDKA